MNRKGKPKRYTLGEIICSKYNNSHTCPRLSELGASLKFFFF